MTSVNEFVEDFLSHEYDPVKAREYYLRTRKLKGRKPGSSADRVSPGTRAKAIASKVDPRSQRTYSGKPLPPLGTRLQEDEVPEVSPNGAKLVDFNGKTGVTKYADGSAYDPNAGWKNWQAAGAKASAEARTKAAAAKDRASAPRERRLSEADKKISRARTLANKVKDPKKKATLLRRLAATEQRVAAARAKSGRTGQRV